VGVEDRADIVQTLSGEDWALHGGMARRAPWYRQEQAEAPDFEAEWHAGYSQQ
jgi:hypothetical protein